MKFVSFHEWLLFISFFVIFYNQSKHITNKNLMDVQDDGFKDCGYRTWWTSALSVRFSYFSFSQYLIGTTEKS